MCFCVCAPQLCQAKGFVCEFCGNGKDIIFPFDLNKCQRCEGEPSLLVAGLGGPRAPSPNPFPAPPWKDWKFPKPRRLARALLQDKREGEGGEEGAANKGEGDENGPGVVAGVRAALRRSKEREVEEEEEEEERRMGEEEERGVSEVGRGEEGEGGMAEEEDVEPGKIEVGVGGESGGEQVRVEKVTLRKALGIDRLVNVFARREQSDSQASVGEPQADRGGGVGKEERRAVWKAPAFKSLGKRFSKIDTESEEEWVEVQKAQKASEGETAQSDVGRKDVGRAVWKVSGFGKLTKGFPKADTGRVEADQEEGTAGKASARETQDVGKAVWMVSPIRKLGKGTERVEGVEVLEEGVPDAAQGTKDEERILESGVAGKARGGAAKVSRFPSLHIPKPPSLTSIFSRGRTIGGGGGGGGAGAGGGDASIREGEGERGVDVEKAGPDDGSEASQESWRSCKMRRARRVSQGREARPGREARATPPGGGGASEPSEGGGGGGGGSVEDGVGPSEER